MNHLQDFQLTIEDLQLTIEFINIFHLLGLIQPIKTTLSKLWLWLSSKWNTKKKASKKQKKAPKKLNDSRKPKTKRKKKNQESDRRKWWIFDTNPMISPSCHDKGAWNIGELRIFRVLSTFGYENLLPLNNGSQPRCDKFPGTVSRHSSFDFGYKLQIRKSEEAYSDVRWRSG